MDGLNSVFSQTVTSESVFQLLAILNQSDHAGVNNVLKMFIDYLISTSKSTDPKSTQMLGSYGIYLLMILRYNPDWNLYNQGKHFIMTLFETFSPYSNLFLSIVLVPGCLKYGKFFNLPFEINSDVSIIDKMKLEYPSSKTFIASLQTLSKNGFKKYKAKNVIDLPINSIGIFLDDPHFMDGEFTESDIQSAIFMHANKILKSRQELLMPHHFDRAILCMNYEIALLLESKSDWIHKSTLDELFYVSKTLQHPVCLDLLILAVRKNVELCDHQLSGLPDDWQVRLLEIYTEPRWKRFKDSEPNSTHATTNFYRMCLSSFSTTSQDVYKELEELETKIGQSKEEYQTLFDNIKVMNMSSYIMLASGYSDFSKDKKLTFGNETDINGDNIFECCRKFVTVSRSNGKIYIFDYKTSKTVLEKGQNIYTRESIPDTLKDEIYTRHCQFNLLGIGEEIPTVKELLDEILRGRKKLQVCNCKSTKTYRHKLLRLLRIYGIQYDDFDGIVISDIIFKLQLIGIDIEESQDIDDLCHKVYGFLKSLEDDKKEHVKKTIASLIKVYKSLLDGAILHEV